MRRNIVKAFAVVMITAVMLNASGCRFIETEHSRPGVNLPDSVTSKADTSSTSQTSSKPEDTLSSADSSSEEERVEVVRLYVTGIEEKIALRESDSNTSQILAQLTLGEEVKLLDDSASETCLFVSYEKKDITGYIRKEYLTYEKNAVCKRQNAYIAAETPLYDSLGNDRNEIQKLGRDDAIFIIAKTSGTNWFVYVKDSKVFGYVNNIDIKTSKSSVESEEEDYDSSAEEKNINLEHIIGKGDAPEEYLGVYSAKVDSGYLAVRSAKEFRDDNVIGRLNTGDLVYVLDDSTGTYWYCYSQKEGIYGYVDSRYLLKN